MMRVCLDQIYIYADCISLNFSLHFVTLFFHFFETEKKGNSLGTKEHDTKTREKRIQILCASISFFEYT